MGVGEFIGSGITRSIAESDVGRPIHKDGDLFDLREDTSMSPTATTPTTERSSLPSSQVDLRHCTPQGVCHFEVVIVGGGTAGRRE